ncbi:stage II sporulation protein D [Bacillus alkalicellulosilyticus]|uniref:stage II sporulation protein D n=1 Tax=Alkalihalobacterium alkalicellulosilyticum TaxID=1912214 RepID=UPI0009987171|nr:stage II sporulation protein D [Bacillus alkalicellulosilyticus]
MKRLLVIGLILTTVILILPTLLVLFFSNNNDSTQPTTQQAKAVSNDTEQLTTLDHDITVSVFRSKQEQIEEVDLEDYVIGVVASEMPASFEIEALKAQALAARTFILKQILNPSDIKVPQGGMVLDSILHQVYHNQEELKEMWGSDYEWRINRIKEAVAATQGQVLTFEGELITASFFSTSNGYTENSEDYWKNPIPYLRSVESPWDEKSPRFTDQTVIPVSEFEQKLKVTLPAGQSIGEIEGRTDGNRVATVNINGKRLTGRQVREDLGLNSSDFNWRRDGNNIIIETKGWGHGVGMSQYGADGMAKEGKNYKEIVSHYYRGVSLTTIDPFVGQLTAMVTE